MKESYASNWAIWDQACHFMLLKFQPNLFEQIAAEWVPARGVELMPSFSRSDPLIYSVGVALKSELEHPGAGCPLYRESLTTTLMLHLLRHYSVQQPSQPPTPGLSKRQLKQVTEYIDHHLSEELTLARLAEIVHLSASYFSNRFKQSTGISPYQYVIQRRIDRAKQLLLQGMSITEVTFSLGFTHQSLFNRHFKRLVGVTPKGFVQHQ